MLRIVTLLLFVAGLAVATAAQDHERCPMAPPDAHRAQVDKRHAEATGVAHEGAVHHFLLAKDGGVIRLEAAGANDVETRDRIRAHLKIVARAFSAGDFSLPMLIHDRVPPGVDAMKKLSSAISYSYAPTEQGGALQISTRDAEALAAIHDFLRFQIQDHGTGDPTE